jgi:hypothetical protein
VGPCDATVEEMLEAVFSAWSMQILCNEQQLLRQLTMWRRVRILPPYPVRRKRRQKGNPVSNETVRYGFKYCGTWI